MRRRTKIIFTSIGILVIVLVSAVIALYPRAMRDVTLEGVDLAGVADGSYTGAFEQGRFSNELTVHVANGRITGIDIIDNVALAGITGASDEVFARVMAAQDTIIDAVSGATMTTRAYLMAIEDALSGAPQRAVCSASLLPRVTVRGFGIAIQSIHTLQGHSVPTHIAWHHEIMSTLGLTEVSAGSQFAVLDAYGKNLASLNILNYLATGDARVPVGINDAFMAEETFYIYLPLTLFEDMGFEVRVDGHVVFID
ncbi:MAG: FMN-binding protein [Defluviitaleaceae bacterium]|nr:FMN-binding protein [Defluviitaleaceae bacterium]